jgi:hypothetical protein
MDAPSPAGPVEGLSFDRAEFAPSKPCSICRQVPPEEYFTSGTATLCRSCLDNARKFGLHDGRGGFARALGLGALAALGGTLVWYLIWKTTGYELALIGIAVGWAVGSAVRRGSGARGGWKYQTLAMALTYLSIVGSYIAPIVEGLRESLAEQGDPAATLEVQHYLFAGGIALIAPFLAGAKNVMGIVIIGVAMYEAWKLNKRPEIVFQGPFQVGAPPAPATAPVPTPIA